MTNAQNSETIILTANGYALCERHARQWRDGGNMVMMLEAEHPQDFTCADCEEEAEQSVTVKTAPKYPHTYPDKRVNYCPCLYCCGGD